MTSLSPSSYSIAPLPITRYAPTKNLRRIGLAPFVAVLFAYCTGGPFALESMISGSGPGLALTFLIVVPFLLSVPISMATAEMTTIMPVEGGFYRWSRAALGDFWGFQCGWWNWTGTFLMSAAYGVSVADYFGYWVPLHSRVEHWALAVVFLLVVAYLNVRGIQVVGNLTLVLLLIMAVPLVIFAVLGFHQARFNPFHPFLPAGKPWQGAYGVGLAIALWTYAGYEQLSTVIEEVENPERNFPIGLAIVIPLSIVGYVVTLAAGLAALGNWQEWDTGYLVTAGRLIGGNALGTGIFVASVIANFALLESTLLSVSRLPLTMAEDGYFHPALGKVNARFGTPVRSILLSVRPLLCSRPLYGAPVNRRVCVDANGDLGADHAFVLAVPAQVSRYAQRLSRSRWDDCCNDDGDHSHPALRMGDDLQRCRHAEVGAAQLGFGASGIPLGTLSTARD